ncbi:MAG TPA: nuclear transport factor 2 family protein [Terriglobales bacterium]|nr:nuclear transport factor 2 family protein [Terriglobales bacterium]
MSRCFAFLCVILLTLPALSQQPSAPAKRDASKPAGSADSALKDLFEARIKTEWEAIKNKDKKAYGDLLADDYQGVEIDGQGERTKTQMLNELANTNVAAFTLWGFKVTPLGPDATFVVYEVTMQFPPRSTLRYSRVYVGALWVRQNGQWKELHYQETHVK